MSVLLGSAGGDVRLVGAAAGEDVVEEAIEAAVESGDYVAAVAD